MDKPCGDMASPVDHLASLAKPPGSLGTLEDWAVTLCTAQRTLSPQVDPARVLVFCGDHGSKRADASLSPYPASVTQAVFRALAAGISGTATLSRAVGAGLTIVDVGIDGDVSKVEATQPENTVRHCKAAHGTADMQHGPAMDEATMERAIAVGRETVLDELKVRGVRVVSVGEVGIGNTTSAAALLALLTGNDATDCCGRGTGLDDEGLSHKVKVVSAACALHTDAIRLQGTQEAQAREALRRVGGLELAAMAGAFMEAGQHGIISIVDGFISGVAALCAQRMQPECRSSMIFATALMEEPTSSRGGDLLTAALDAKPALSMGLRLGEGSGAALVLPLLRAASAVVTEMGSLKDALALMPPPQE
eukprot:TRINITY_DN107076_c0_g1_i1.p1 TRINITY_DN107076_c0_g1~~TRINITY_DN107076_c0_g1_i1.p1  ORF type:complete len:383 (-),score=59.45 TRINITY_DN107076_c0_g1_i1:443-1537(-)